ncbi:MAG TPA: MoaD/ThiS family protein [Bryobacteraceae bacterium]|nr:MoaD/ThiS family protein [Bryobacteraceae bacterium]
MIVYSDREETVDTHSFAARVRAASDPQERLILEGQFEAGVADALCPEIDDEVDLCRVVLPELITIRKPEGYAFYSLYPELYRDAALRFLREHTPRFCLVIGIRSIGASLSRVVAEAVHATSRFTVRPHGHPFDRHIRLSRALEDRVRAHIPQGWFLIVDEGPGLSGSSFMSVATKLEELGVPRNRIVLFPSHEPNPDDFVSERARKNWRRYLRYVEPFPPHRFVPRGAEDISGGAWRSKLYSDDVSYPAVHPYHERRKYLHDGHMWKFAGLAHFGREKYDRALRLKEFCPPVRCVDNGFMVTGWIPAQPATLTDGLLDAMARYLAFLRAEFATGQDIPAEALQDMIEANTARRVEAPLEGVVVAVDGRMLPKEWLQTEHGYLKTDAVDHHDDHFFPGCQDIAWDIAGAAVEWGFPVEALADRFLRLVRDPTLYARLPFYRTAYCAYRYGYCQLALDALGDSPDGRRFRLLQWRYAL